MNNEIEVGEYVRTIDGIIDKVENYSIGCCVWHCQNGMCIDKCNCIGTHLEDIVNHSKIKSEIVEVGDYVNGERIHTITTDKHLLTERNENILDKYRDIKSIVTKEQFSSVEYVF